ncbi:MAG: FAD-dependent monooxygenase [Candidatus Thermoplasmatota archaeon]|nr:FAD-dependent monooxygenase [Candidatus Thermoplasmatota archaeon]
MISINKTDIIIVGGGPAGISTWLHLNKLAPDLASKTILIEKERYPRDKLCGGGLGGWSEYVLNKLDIKLNIPFLPIDDTEFVYGDDTYVLHQKGSFRMVQRIDFDNLLAKTAIKRGLNLRENESFLDLKRTGNGLSVKTTKGIYYTKILIGADGSLSKVCKKIKTSTRSYLAPTLEIFNPSQPEFDSEYENKKITVDMTPIKENLQGYLWHVPFLKDNIPFIGHGLVDFRIYKNKPKADLKNIFNKALQNRKIQSSPNSWKSHPIKWYSPNEKISENNILLVGDASGVDPAFGGGIHFSLSYGDIASKEIINAYNNEDFSFDSYKENINSHLIGKFLYKCTNVSLALYDNKINPIEAAKQIFTIKKSINSRKEPN